ncbi:MAG: hypothetical protein HFG28_10345 [Eubacterium sp.]|nr:hypothetical protein [Eubacterium sp.]
MTQAEIYKRYYWHWNKQNEKKRKAGPLQYTIHNAGTESGVVQNNEGNGIEKRGAGSKAKKGFLLC